MRLLLTPDRQNRLAALLLGFCVLGLLSILTSSWSWSDLVQPRIIDGDPLEIFARVKLSGEQPAQTFTGFSSLNRLGAPFGGDWSAYPAPDSILFFVAGQLARVVGVFGAVKIAGALCYLLSAYSFFLCARHLRWRVEWAFAGALLFAFSNYNIRWAVTLSFNQTFTLPPLVLLCSHASKSGFAAAGGRNWLWLGALLGVWLGIGNPYLAFFAGLLASSTLVLALIRRCPMARLAPLSLFLLSLMGMFAMANFQYALAYLTAGEENPLARDFSGTLIYALKPLDWFIPSVEHRFHWAALIGRQYFAHAKVMGAFFPAYLGFVGIAGLLGLLVYTIARLAKRRPPPDAMLGIALITVYGVAGGFNALLGILGLDLFRASQRISILANVWVLFFIIGWLQSRFCRTPRSFTLAAATFLAFFGWWEQTPEFRFGQKHKSVATQWEDVRTLTHNLEATLGKDTAVFQLPVRRFPEAGPLGEMPDYEHFKPFLVDSSLRFSYGPLAYSKLLNWQQYVSKLPAPAMVKALEQSGFSAIWIDTRAFSDHGDELVHNLCDQQRTEFAHGTAAPIRIIQLHPAATPVLPRLDDVRHYRTWSDRPGFEGSSTLHVLHGWYPLEQAGDHQWRWARKRGEVGVWCSGPEQLFTLKFNAWALRDDILELEHAGDTLLKIPLAAGERHEIEIPITLSTGQNLLAWHISGKPDYPAGGDTRKLGFMIEDLELLPAPYSH